MIDITSNKHKDPFTLNTTHYMKVFPISLDCLISHQLWQEPICLQFQAELPDQWLGGV